MDPISLIVGAAAGFAAPKLLKSQKPKAKKRTTKAKSTASSTRAKSTTASYKKRSPRKKNC